MKNTISFLLWNIYTNYPVIYRTVIYPKLLLMIESLYTEYTSVYMYLLDNICVVLQNLSKFHNQPVFNCTLCMYKYAGFFFFVFQHPHLGSRGRKCPGLSDDQRQMLQVFDPACDLSCDGSCDKMAAYNKDTIGFFIAKFTKIKKWQIKYYVVSYLLAVWFWIQ